jgi:GT2 family glycosyltransferase
MRTSANFLQGRANVRKLFIVSCTRGRKEETDLFRSLRKLGMDCFLFFENNQEGLPTCYNRILNEKAGGDEIVIFVHDDVTIGDVFLQEKITEAFDQKNYAITGLAGTADFKIRPDPGVISWFQPPAEALSGAVETYLPDGSTIMSAFGPTPKRCVVLDGLFLAADLRRIGHVRFEEQLAFHFYDLDFCLTAHQAGLSLGTINIYVIHRSGGHFSSQAFEEAQTTFRAKWTDGHYRIDAPARQQGADKLIMHEANALSQVTLRRNELCHCGSGRKYKHCHGQLR